MDDIGLPRHRDDVLHEQTIRQDHVDEELELGRWYVRFAERKPLDIASGMQR